MFTLRKTKRTDGPSLTGAIIDLVILTVDGPTPFSEKMRAMKALRRFAILLAVGGLPLIGSYAGPCLSKSQNR
jgi:hypothetical protein